jgi:hypothetical protein
MYQVAASESDAHFEGLNAEQQVVDEFDDTFFSHNHASDDVNMMDSFNDTTDVHPIDAMPKLTRASLESLSKSAQRVQADPISIFLDSPLSEYPVDINVIKESADSGQAETLTNRFSPYNRGSRANSDNSGSSSAGSAVSSGQRSIQSAISNISRSSRRGRRRYAQGNAVVKAMPVRPYFCTFCPQEFSEKWSWSRHEESVHVPRTTWVCTPHGHTGQDCLYCNAWPLTTSEENKGQLQAHLAKHRYAECRQKPIDERLFMRRDHLVQHIKQFHLGEEHGNTLSTNHLDNWASKMAPLPQGSILLHCGFCGKDCADWEDRIRHLAWHFKGETHKTEWWLERANHRSRGDHVAARSQMQFK